MVDAARLRAMLEHLQTPRRCSVSCVIAVPMRSPSRRRVQCSQALVQVAAESQIDGEVERISRSALRNLSGTRAATGGTDARRRTASTTATAVPAAARVVETVMAAPTPSVGCLAAGRRKPYPGRGLAFAGAGREVALRNLRVLR
jgi:hypothetical protein